MARHSLEQALILNSRQIGEDNRIIIMLSPQRGIFEAVLYGVAGGALALVGNTLQGVCCGSLAVILFSALYPIKTVRNLFNL